MHPTYRLAGIIFFAAAIVFFVTGKPAMGSPFLVLGIVFVVLDGKERGRSE